MKQDETTPEEARTAKVPGDPAEDQSAVGRPKWLPRPLTLVFAASALVIAAILGVFLLTAEWPTSGTVVATGAPQIGGPFELVDQTGHTVTQADFAGKYMLIYFGFTYCPDVCPTALHVMSTALDSLGERADRIQPIFISIDPERDTPENMAAYVKHFDERMVGLTGSPEQVRKAASAYRVFYKKGQGSGGAEYLMDHTSVIYLMDPDGKFAAHFNHTTSPDEIAKGIAKVLDRNDR